MTAASCPRLFEVEAMRDGRLTGAERARFELHMRVCAACAREAAALQALAEAVRAGVAGGAHADALHVRRQRTRLLAAFDRALLAPERRPTRSRRLLVAAAGAGALLCGLLWLVSARSAAPAAPVPTLVVRARGAARWSRRLQGERELITLEHGTLFVHVDHRGGSTQRRLLVALPDGELEDVGTTFTVSAAEGHTARVAVEEGEVVLRLRAQPALVIGAGGTWAPVARPAPPAASIALPSAASRTPERPRSAPTRAHAAPAHGGAHPDRSARSADPALEFRAAMAALDAGDDHRAAAGFAEFIAAHPHDPRAEDAAYLRILALQRAGDEGSMRAATLEYLGRYPAGFRRSEVERLAR